MAEIGDLKIILPPLPSRTARPTEKSGDQGRQKQSQQPKANTTRRDDDEQDKDNHGHIDEYV